MMTDKGRKPHIWDSVGYADHHLGQYEQVAACYHRAVKLFRAQGDRCYEPTVLRHLGETHRAAGAERRPPHLAAGAASVR